MEVTKMTKYVKKHFLLSTLLFSLLLISCLYSSLATPVYAAEPDIQDKTMAILDEVVAINTTEYKTHLNSLVDNQFHSLAQKEADITLASAEGRVRVKSSFVNNNIHQIYICNYEGKLAVEQPAADTVEMAKGVLENYKNFVGDSFYGELASMLVNVDGTKNTTKTDGNIKLEALNLGQTIIDYIWTYTDENGIIAKSKKVLLSYEKGRLKIFRNDWPLYTVVGTPKISGEEATAIAIEASKTFSYEVCTDNDTSTVTGFEIAPESLDHEVLSYLNNPNQSLARGGDPFTLYPSWYVPLGFSKSYPGAVTGMIVTVWADTGEVSGTNPMVLDLPPTIVADEEASTSSTDEEAIKDGFDQDLAMLSVPIGVTALFSVFGVALASRKNVKFACGRKLFPRFWGTLMCGILMLSLVLVATPQVTAIVDPYSVAEIYAALDGGGDSPPQLETEKTAARNLTAEIDEAFEASGYTLSYDWAGDYTTKSNVINRALWDEEYSDFITVFHFGHMSRFNIGYVDNDGVDIWSDNIDNAVDTTKHKFVFIFACAQAYSTDSNGTAAAWTSRTDLNADGYSDPDGDGQCYIGFDYFSPLIGDTEYGTFYEEETVGPFKDWVELFYNASLYDCHSVKEALDQACLSYFEEDFGSSILNTGYNSWWPGDDTHTYPDPNLWEDGYYPLEFYPENPNNTMRVFGDGDMGFSLPTMTISATTGGATIPSGTYRYTYGHSEDVIAQTMDPEHYHFSHWELNGATYSYSESLSIEVEGNYNLTAVFNYDPTYRLTIYSGPGGTTNPEPGLYSIPVGTYVYVTAIPDDGYDFDYWILEGNQYNDETISFLMLGHYTLEAHFIRKYCLTIQSWYGGHTVPSAGEYYYPEGEYAEVTAYVDDPENWEWSHWMRDGQDYSDDETVRFQMTSDHTLKPIWIYDPQIEYHDLTLVYMAWFWGWIYLGGGTSSLPEDYYTFTAPSTVYGLDFVCWDYEGNYYYDQTITIFLDSDQYLAAIYVPS
jgi:hypothetical protein